VRRLAAILLATVLVVAASGVASAAPSVLRASPSTVRFGTRPVGSITLKSTRLTNRSDATFNVLVTVAALPDDFSFGLLPGSDCPVFDPAPLAPGESCNAVVQFRPTEFFAGAEQTATLVATATDPAGGAELASISINFTGTGR
jgi:hypothetical protein